MKQKEEIELKAPVMWEIISAASINVWAMRRNKTKTPDSIMPALRTVFSILLSIRNRNMNHNMAINSIILRRGGGGRQDDLQTTQRIEFLLVVQGNTQTAGQLWVTTGKHCTSVGKECH